MKKLEELNFHHLLYFWIVAHEGSVTGASRRLGLAQPSVSAQVRKLEETLGGELFERAGRGRMLSDLGREVLRHAEHVFGAGQELIDSLNSRQAGSTVSLVVGVPDVMPRLVAQRLILPLCQHRPAIAVECHGSRFEELLGDLAVSRFDVVLSHAPMASHLRIKAYNHKLGESGVTVFAHPGDARRLREGFPGSLAGSPMLLPTEGTELRRSLDQWFDQRHIAPRVVGEFSDSALLKELGGAGVGAFVSPSVVENEVCRQYGVESVGRMAELREEYFAITTQRRIQHPGVALIVDAARANVFT
ncbi:MAG: LysR family transcriptional regulator [Lacipirellulaceae bacterium]